MRSSSVEKQEGMVLLLVLVVVALLTALLTELAFSTLVDFRLAETFRDNTKAYYLARGGVRAGLAILKHDDNDYDAADELWGQGVPEYPVAEGVVDIQIDDYDGRLSLNALVGNDGPQAVQKERLVKLFELLDLEEPATLVAALIDWLDGDGQTYDREGVHGAESDYYLSLNPGYESRNGPMLSYDELTLIRGFSQEMATRLAPHISVYGTTQVNLNTATPEVMVALSQDPANPLSLEEAIDVDSERARGPFIDMDDFKKRLPDQAALLPINQNLQYHIKLTSDYYHIRSQGRVRDGSSIVSAAVRKATQKLLLLKVD